MSIEHSFDTEVLRVVVNEDHNGLIPEVNQPTGVSSEEVTQFMIMYDRASQGFSWRILDAKMMHELAIAVENKARSIIGLKIEHEFNETLMVLKFFWAGWESERAKQDAWNRI
ncbi:MAG: hypothetical protein WC455_09075 [Dehalococcoidia bacterium]|jgi:hypothetical protein